MGLLISNKSKIMTKTNILKKDYILILILSVLYFLSVKNVIPTFAYLIIALVGSFYFFPIKLFLDKNLFNETRNKKIAKILSYFVIGNIIVFSALMLYVDGPGFFRNSLFVYGILNSILLFYFYFTENVSSNFILSACTIILISATTSI